MDRNENDTRQACDISLTDLLIKLKEMGGSDLHIRINTPPQVRVNGEMVVLPGYRVLTPGDTKTLAMGYLTDAQKRTYEETLDLDFSFGVNGVARFRANVFSERGAAAAVYRIIPWEIKAFDELGLPPVVARLCERPRGLVLVTGPTGSGKSTTLAAMIDKVNTERRSHILTMEDPVEFVHQHKGCLVTQREISADTRGFLPALRAALRQDPDVVLIGEMRDLETIEMALRIAETGHLTFATLHTNSASSTINRIIDVFPAGQQPQIRSQLALVLEGVLSQTLLPNLNGDGRSMALEILVPNSAIRNLIREDKIHQIYGLMQTSRKDGMQTLNMSLASLYQTRKISMEMALYASPNPEELKDLIGRSGTMAPRAVPVTTSRPGAPAGA